jgi:hypothetical protein
MFRDSDFRYLVASVTIVLILTALAVSYEIGYITGDSWFETIIAVIRWQGAIVPVTLIFLATWEVFKVIADRIIARNRERIRQEAHEQGREEMREEIIRQLEGLPEDVRRRIPFLSDLSEGNAKKN